jgi:hypothetical protein
MTCRKHMWSGLMSSIYKNYLLTAQSHCFGIVEAGFAGSTDRGLLL